MSISDLGILLLPIKKDVPVAYCSSINSPSYLFSTGKTNTLSKSVSHGAPDPHEPSSLELSQLQANIDALTASVAQFRAASKAGHNRLMNSMNELRGEVTGLKKK